MSGRIVKLLGLLFIVAAVAIIFIKLYEPSRFPTNSPLVIARDEGGICDYGLCWEEKTINRNGTWDTRTGGGAVSHGNLDPEIADLLKGVTEHYDPNTLDMRGKPDECSSVHDSLRFVITIFSTKGMISVDSCHSEVDYDQSPFVEILEAMRSVSA
jgi:hypothetical protein